MNAAIVLFPASFCPSITFTFSENSRVISVIRPKLLITICQNCRNKKYYGNDSRGPVRIRVEKHDPTPGYKGPNNPYHCNPHFHIDRREKGSSGPFRKVFTGLMEWLR